MDESGIEATQALDFGDIDDETDDGLGDNEPVAFLNVACQKGFPGKSYPVYEGDNVIGRHEDCTISIPLKALSREHACIEVKGDSHFIYDKGSRNRTRRNQHFLAASVRYELKNKDKLTFGDVECEYQIGTQAADDDETGSESEFQTAPNDRELEQTVDTNSKDESKLLEEEDYESDASSDILEPTQPFAGNTQSMLHHKTLNGHSTLGQNVTIKDTPAPVSRSMRFTAEELLIPESDTDDEGPSKPPATLALAADSQEDEDEEVKSKLIGAATQAYVCESDVTTDDEADELGSKKSLLAAPTQAFVQDDDDVSTCSEDSPQKRRLMTAATQAFVADSEDDKTPSRAQMAPTLAYDMDEGIEPTQGYDMEEDDEKPPKDDLRKKMMFEPTQAYLGAKSDDAEDDKSETSEEFVLEGDTDAEEEDTNLLAAPTLAMDDVSQAVSADEATQIVDSKVDHGDATVAVADDATQVFDEPIPKQKGKNTKAGKTSKTQPVTEAETQVFEDMKDKCDVEKKNQGLGNDATQIFDDHNEKTSLDTVQTQIFDDNATQVFDNECKSEPVGGKKKVMDQSGATRVLDDGATQVFDNECKSEPVGRKKKVMDQSGATRVLDDGATQVFDNECKSEPVGRKKKVMDQSGATRVLDDGATQCFDDKTDSTAANTQIFDEPTQDVEENNQDKCLLKNEEMATQVFENKEQCGEKQETGEERETFDINAECTLAVTDDADSKSADAKPEEVATQVFDDADAAVNDQTMSVETENKSGSTRGKGRKKKNVSKVTSDDATQVFDETVVVSDQTVCVDESAVQLKSTRGKGRQKKTDNTMESTQVFDETLSDQTGTVSEPVKGSKSATGKSRQINKKKTEEHVTDDATQVFDETQAVSDQTIPVHETVGESKSTNSRQKNIKSKETITSSDDATQVFDETQAVSDQTVLVNGTACESKATKSQSRQKNIKSKTAVASSDDATQVFDETVGVSDQTVAVDETIKQEKPTRGRGKKNNKNKTDDIAAVSDDATQVFDVAAEPSDQTVDVKESESKLTRGRGKKKPEKKKATIQKDETSLVSDQTLQITNDQTLAIEESQNDESSESITKTKSVTDETQVSVDNITENKTVATESTENITENKQGRSRTKKDDSISATPGINIDIDTQPIVEPVESNVRSSRRSDINKQPGKAKGRKGGKQTTENSSEDKNVREEKNGIESKETEDNNAENETNNKEDSDSVNSTTRRKSGRQVKPKKFADEEPDKKNSKDLKGKTSVSDKTEEEDKLVKNVRKSGRARSKATTSDKNEEETSANKVKNSDISEMKSEPVKGETSAVAKRRGGNTPVDQKKTEVAAEPETQAYTEDAGPSDMEATQKYGDADDDSTPDLMNMIGSEDQTIAPVVVEELSRGRSPLKSALASPKKKKTSPSPRKVMFVSQNSETGSESGESSRSSKRRGGNGRQQKNAGKAVAASEQSEDKEPDTKAITSHNNEHEQPASRVETENDLKDEVVAETKKSGRRGRKSVDTATTVKQNVKTRNTRTSLPTVLERLKPETSQTEDSTENKESKPETSLTEELAENKESEKATKSVGRSRSKGKGKLDSVKEIDVAPSTDANISISDSNVKKSSRLRNKKDEEITETKSDTTNDSTNVEEEPAATRSGRSTRSKETRESLKPDTKTGTGRKRKLGDGDQETENQPEDDSNQASRNDVKSKKTKSDISEVDTSENIPDTEQTDAAGDKNNKKGKGKVKGTKGGKVGKTETVEEETVHPTPVSEEVEDSSQSSFRSRRGRGSKIERNEKTVPETEPKDAEVKENTAKRGGRLKRKESASSSNDSQEGESEETPAKRQRKKNDPSASTPKQQTKQAGGVSTPKVAANKTLDTTVTNSPVLRKTTTEGIKAKVMFTGVVDEQGEKIVKELGGELVSSVMDCTHLVTDQVRRTVKFLCCLSRGVPIVSPQWLASSKTSAFFVDTAPFLVSDESSERKYKFRLDHSIEKASREPLFKDFTFHITKSVKPDPPQMREILNCAGAKVVNTMPHKASDILTVVISCPDDQHLCEPAYKAGLPVVTAEFVLTGILRQEVDWNSFKLEKDDSGNRRQSLAAEKRKKK